VSAGAGLRNSMSEGVEGRRLGGKRSPIIPAGAASRR